MAIFKTKFYIKLKLSKMCFLLIMIAPFLISYPLYLSKYNHNKTYLIETKAYSNDDIIQIYKMIPTYRWSICGGGDLNFKKISNYSVSLIPMLSSADISLISNDAEYGKSFIKKIVDVANCVYGESKKNEIEYYKKVESMTISSKNVANKFLDADNAYVNNYLMGLKELSKYDAIKNYLGQQSSDQLSITTKLVGERSISYPLIVLLFFICELLILLPRIFLPIRSKNV